MKFKKTFTAVMCTFSVLLAVPAQAQQFPSKPVTIVGPYSAGGPADVILRPLAASLQEKWGQSVVIEPRTGANGIIAAQYVIRGPNDGHTLMFGITGLLQNPYLMKKPPYDFFNDLTPVALFGHQPVVLMVPASSPYKNVSELATAIKEKPQDFSYGSYGAASTSHIFGELFNTTLKAGMPHAAYRGEGPLIPEVMSGRIPFAFMSATSGVYRTRDKTLRALAVSGTKRLPQLPDVPTMAEEGYKNFDMNGWWGLFVSSKVPQPLVAKLTADVNAVLQEPELQARLFDAGLAYVSATPPEITAAFRKDAVGWEKLIRQLNISSN